MNKIYKVLGKCGRITIPFEIRQRLGFSYNDVVSFQIEDNTITVKREKVCDDCNTGKMTSVDTISNSDATVTLLELLDGLSEGEQRAALIHLSVKWAQTQGDKRNG